MSPGGRLDALFTQAAEGLVEFGSRLGLLSRDGSAVAAWPDTRNSRPDTTTQDIFTTIVTIPASETDEGPAVLMLGAAGLVAMAGGAAFVATRIRRRRQPAALEEPA